MGEGSCGPLATGSVPGSVDGEGVGEGLPPSDGDGGGDAGGETDTDGDGPACEALGLGPGSRRVVLGAGLALVDALGFEALADGSGVAPALCDGVAPALPGASSGGATPAAASSEGAADSAGSGLVST